MGKISTPTQTTEQVVERTPNPTIHVHEDMPKDEVSDDIDLELIENDISLIPIKREFGIRDLDTEYNQALKEMIARAKEMGIKKRSDFIAEIRTIKDKLGAEFEPDRVALYLRLQSQTRKLMKQMYALEK